MKKVERPNENGYWESFSSSEPIAWKTGTSYGHRDAWSVGVNRRYTVGVWVGNADGEGRPEIIGNSAAGSLMFDIWNILPSEKKGFGIPHDDLREYNICKKSGQIASTNCVEVEIRLYPKASKWANPCAYHRQIFLDITRSFRTYLDCEENVIDTSWFVLPPSMAYYYKRNHPEYSEIPIVHDICNKEEKNKTMDVLYPAEGEVIFMPKGLDGQKTELIVKAVHAIEDAEVYWHIDGEYIGMTSTFHFLKIFQETGEHRIMIMDKKGNKLDRKYYVGGKEITDTE
jgi:penicillin-binding protein 1C